MNVPLYKMKIHNSNPKKWANSVIVILSSLDNTILDYGSNEITKLEFDYSIIF